MEKQRINALTIQHLQNSKHIYKKDIIRLPINEHERSE